jgi:Acetyltransferase (GNAT) family.
MIKLMTVKKENLGEFAKQKTLMIKEHIMYASELGVHDSIAINYDEKRAIKYFGKQEYTQQLIIVDGEIVGITEYKKIKSEIDEKSNAIFLNAIYIQPKYREKKYAYETIKKLKQQYKIIELDCYYNLKAHDFYKKIGFLPYYQRYFIK